MKLHVACIMDAKFLCFCFVLTKYQTDHSPWSSVDSSSVRVSCRCFGFKIRRGISGIVERWIAQAVKFRDLLVLSAPICSET